MSDLLPVEEALRRILDGVECLEDETVSLREADGRVLAQDLISRRTQPPFPASAMDGYAVRASDLTTVPATLKLIGESAAGHGFSNSVGQGECVRIFTGAPVPEGANAIAIQENANADGEKITFRESVVAGRYVRPAGMDFSEGDLGPKAGRTNDPALISLAAAMNFKDLSVRRKPVVAIIASGDELMLPGGTPGPDQIIASNSFGVSAIVVRAGGTALDCGIAKDTLASLDDKFEQASQADIVVTLGGASVGDHDLVREALESRGVEMSFLKLAMRPGKPVMFGLGEQNGRKMRYLGLPGNPVSSLVGSIIFLVPLIRSMLGLSAVTPRHTAKLAIDLPQNDQREEYMRSTISTRGSERFITPFDTQDSSLLSLYAKAECLLVRPAFAPSAKAHESCEIILLE